MEMSGDTTVLKDEDCHLYTNYWVLPDGQKMLFVHATVYGNKRAALRKSQEAFADLRKNTDGPIFAQGTNDDSTLEHWVRLHGFEYLCECPCTDGKDRRIFVSYPK